LWRTGGLFIKLTTLDAYQVTFYRSLLAGITVLIATRKTRLRINFFGFACSLIYAALLFVFVWATKQPTAANAIFLQYTSPICIASFPILTTKDVFAVSFLGIVQIGIAYILFIKGVSGGTRPLDASIIGFIEPLLNPVWVFLFVGEQPSNWALIGGTIIIAT